MVRGCFKKSPGVPGTLEGFVLQRSFFELMNKKQFFQPKNGALLKILSNGRFLGKFRRRQGKFPIRNRVRRKFCCLTARIENSETSL